MNNRIQWRSSNEFDKQQVETKINQLQDVWNIKLPSKYIKIVLAKDSAMPYVIYEDDGQWHSAGIKLPTGSGREQIGIISLKEIYDDYFGDTTFMDIVYDELKKALPQGVYPFATNGSGDYILFDFRSNEVEPEIKFIDHDELITEDELDEDDLEEKTLEEWQSEKIFFVAKSFDEFLELIGEVE